MLGNANYNNKIFYLFCKTAKKIIFDENYSIDDMTMKVTRANLVRKSSLNNR